MSYQSFANEFSSRALAASAGLSQAGAVPAFSNGAASLAEVLAMFSREAELNKMRQLMNAKHDACEWVPPKSRCEVLAGCERDARVRYHNRLNSYTAGIDGPHATKVALAQHVSDTDSIAAKAT